MNELSMNDFFAETKYLKDSKPSIFYMSKKACMKLYGEEKYLQALESGTIEETDIEGVVRIL